MTNLEKAKDLYHKIGMEETMLSALCEMAEWKEQQMTEKAVGWITERREIHRFLWSDVEDFKQAMREE